MELAHNHIELMGRLAAAAETRTLPSGDDIVVFRLIVARPEGSRVDTIDCLVDSAALRKRMLKMPAGTQLELHGRLERRFWRSVAGVSSRYEVRAAAVKRAA